MAYDLEEQEKLASLQSWWNEYGGRVSAACTVLLLVIAAYFGWLYWQRTQAQAASALYDQFLKQVDEKKVEARDLGGKLQQEYGRTVYASLASLMLARVSFDANDLASAKLQLQWVIDRSGRVELNELARVRLAGVLIDEKAYGEAARVLAASTPSEAAAAAFEDRRGDLFFAQGQVDEARAAWQRGLQATSERHPLRNLIQQKLDMLPEAK